MSLLDRIRRPSATPRIDALTLAKPKPKRESTTEVGRSGTVNTRGFISDDETNPRLRWPQNLDEYDLMARTDPTVRWMLALITTPIRAAMWTVTPAGTEPDDREVAAFVEECLFGSHLEGGWDEWLRHALDYVRHGHAVFERVAGTADVTFSYEAPRETAADEPKTVDVSRQATILRKLAVRLPRTIQRWVPDESDPGRLAAIQQWLTGTQSGNVPIPAERLVVLTYDKVGDDWRGQSILRPVWRAWNYKVQLENLEAIAYERTVGVPIVYPPDNATDGELDSVEAAIKDMRQGENLWLIMPGPKQGSGKDAQGWLVEDLNVSGDGRAGGGGPSEAIARHEAAMARNVLAEFMRLGHEQVGARATADVQQDPYWQAIQAQCEYLSDVISEQIVKPLVDWNYDVDRYPRVVAGELQARNVQSIADAISKLTGTPPINADPDLEAWLREMLGAPEALEVPEEKEEPPQVPVVPESEPEPGDGEPAISPDEQPPDVPETPEPFSEPRRALRGVEQFVDVEGIGAYLDRQQDDLAAQAEQAAAGPIAEQLHLVDQAVSLGNAEIVTKLAVDEGPIAQALERVLAATYDTGRQHVRDEIRRQRHGGTFADERQVPAPAERVRLISAKAKAAAAAIGAAASRALRQLGLRRLEAPDSPPPIGPGFDPLAAVRAEARGAALGIISAAWNDGRADEQVARTDELEKSIYSAILDRNSCGACEERDGEEGPPGGSPELPTPNPECAGGGACRCAWIPVVSVPSAIPPDMDRVSVQ